LLLVESWVCTSSPMTISQVMMFPYNPCGARLCQSVASWY
jgi:hypothetical protein